MSTTYLNDANMRCIMITTILDFCEFTCNSLRNIMNQRQLIKL